MRSAVVLLAAAAAAGAACFSERGPTAPAADAALCAATPPPNVVQVRDFTFRPAELRVAAGATVTWVNCETSAGPSHTSTADDEGWDSGLLAPRTRFSRPFAAAGRFPYHCEPHPAMRGAVVVE
jgi:plastocyanin